jgi:zinc protease
MEDGRFAHEVERCFASGAPGPMDILSETIAGEFRGEMTTEKRLTMQDHVQLRRLYWVWPAPPAYQDGTADLDLATRIVGDGRTSRLYKRLVHAEKLAQDVSFDFEPQQVSSIAILTVTLRPDADSKAVESLVNEELARFASKGATSQELEQARNDFQANFLRSIQSVGGFRGINDRLNRYNHYVGTPNYLKQDWERYASRTPATMRNAFARWIGPGRMVVEVQPVVEGRPVVADVERSILPTPGPSPKFNAPDVERKKLANGLEVVFLKQRELPLVQMDMVFHSGSASEPADRSGLCDMTASMHLEGTKRRDKFAFESALEALGTNLSAWANEDRTLFTMQCLATRLDESTALLAEALLEPAFPADEFTDLQQRRLLDIRRRADQPYAILANATRSVHGDDHPYGRPTDGTGVRTRDRARRRAPLLAGASGRRTFTLVVVGDTASTEIRASSAPLPGRTGAAPRTIIPEPTPARGRPYLVEPAIRSPRSPSCSSGCRAMTRAGRPHKANRLYGVRPPRDST